MSAHEDFEAFRAGLRGRALAYRLRVAAMPAPPESTNLCDCGHDMDEHAMRDDWRCLGLRLGGAVCPCDPQGSPMT